MDKVARIWKNETPQEMYDRMIKEEKEKLKSLLNEINDYLSKNKNNLNYLEKEFLENLEYRINDSLEDKYELKLKNAFRNIYTKNKWNIIYYNDDRLIDWMKPENLDYNKHQSLYKEHIHTGKTEEELEKDKLKLETINLDLTYYTTRRWFLWFERKSKENIDYNFSKNEEAINNLKELGLNDKEIKNVFENYSSFLEKMSKLESFWQHKHLNEYSNFPVYVDWLLIFNNWIELKSYSFWNRTNLTEYSLLKYGNNKKYNYYETFYNYNVDILKLIANSKNKTAKQLEDELKKIFKVETFSKEVIEKIEKYRKNSNSKDYSIYIEDNKLYVNIRSNWTVYSWHFSIPRTSSDWKLLNEENMKFFWADSDKHFDEFVAKIRKKIK